MIQTDASRLLRLWVYITPEGQTRYLEVYWVCLLGVANRIEKLTTSTWITVPIINRLWKTNAIKTHNLLFADDWQERLNEYDRYIAKQHESTRKHYNKTSNQLKFIPTGCKVRIQLPKSKMGQLPFTVGDKIENMFSYCHRAERYVETDTSILFSEILRT
ncbi:unnamed protein product [Lepeophtheirus salmonis]|uniref:(salmon louse) hypothetical protein n=1 Tax=Lepeophtheirus salmonis TaxID=72036 RepID=A0A7R8D9C2_LEPSM|nr:unnamed protein product [Lepeophtheirus salmonis]CAF3016670.1 unnamed protein product [Lepeophtheirus salmonis]